SIETPASTSCASRSTRASRSPAASPSSSPSRSNSASCAGSTSAIAPQRRLFGGLGLRGRAPAAPASATTSTRAPGRPVAIALPVTRLTGSPVRGGPRRRPADQRGARSRTAHVVDPDQALLADQGTGAGDRAHVAVDLRHRVVLVVHVRLLDRDVYLLALAERERAVLD